MNFNAVLYHLSQTLRSLGNFQILLSWWGLFCAFGVGLNYFKVWGYLCLYVVGRCFLSWLHEEFANFYGSAGSQFLPWASFSKKLLCVCGHKCCVHVYSCVCGHTEILFTRHARVSF